MGFRFSLQAANTVANLSMGKVLSCYRDIIRSERDMDEFLDFLNRFEQNYYTGRGADFKIEIDGIIRKLICYMEKQKKKNNIKHISDHGWEEENSFWNDKILIELKKLSDVFNRCKIKALLLPSMDWRRNTHIHTTEILRRLVEMHPGDSCLILQPDEITHSPEIFNAFPHFEIALKNIDLWPAVLFWDDNNQDAFVPVHNEMELNRLFQIVMVERDPIWELKTCALEKQKAQNYLIHLSDLHIGDHNILNGIARIKSMVQKQVQGKSDKEKYNVLITGDVVDSPNQCNYSQYDDFANYMQICCGSQPIRVLGNHDIDRKGISLLRCNRHIASLTSDYPKIKILEDEKIILLLFNSNVDGSLAKGHIGRTQMAEMGNKLDRLRDFSDYNLIAVLHHHITDIPRPDFFAKKIFGPLIDKTLILDDADIFIQWLKARNVKVVLHGHKHIPFLTDVDGIKIIACGSSTGQVAMKEKGKTYISYNVFKISKNRLICTQFVEDILGAGEKDIRSDIIIF